MKSRDCQSIRDLLPEVGAETLAPEERGVVEAHLDSCLDCRRELEVIVALKEARPEVPPGLEATIRALVRDEMAQGGPGLAEPSPPATEAVVPLFGGRPPWAPGWSLSAAAVVILALGVGVLWNQRAQDFVQDPIVVASQEPLPEAWLWDDGMVAGAPVFDGLSDEDLVALLEELEG